MEERTKIGVGSAISIFDEIVLELSRGTELVARTFDSSVTWEQIKQVQKALLVEADSFTGNAEGNVTYKMVSHVNIDLNEITVVANPVFIYRLKCRRMT